MKKYIFIILCLFGLFGCKNNDLTIDYKANISINDNTDNICITCICSNISPVSLTGVELLNNNNDLITFNFEDVEKSFNNNLYTEKGVIIINNPVELREFLNIGFTARAIAENKKYSFSDSILCY